MVRLPSYRLHKSSGQGVTTIRGKDYYFGPFAAESSKQKFRKLLAEYLASSKSKSFGVNAKVISIAECVESYLDHAEIYYRDSTEYPNLVLAANPLMELYADSPAVEFSTTHFKAVRAWWIQRGSSRQYVNKQMKRLLRIVKWLVAEGLMELGIYQGLKCVEPLRRGRSEAPEAPPVRPVPDAIVEATVGHLSSVVAAMVRFQRLTGARPGEVCAIKPSMVDRSSEIWEIKLSCHKNAWRGKERTIYAGPKAQSVLLPYLFRSIDAYCFSPKESVAEQRKIRSRNRTTPLSCGNKPGSNRESKPSRKPSDCYTTQSYGRAIRYACKKAFPAPKDMSKKEKRAWEFEHSWSPNQLRHALATSIRKSDGLEAAAVLLGHSEVGVTQIYAEADRQKAIDVVKRTG